MACVSDPAMADLFLDLAKTYHGYADGLFRLFITVLFGSFAFASSFPIKTSSKLTNIGKFHVTSTSLATASVLLSFYMICFLSFRSAIVNAHLAASQFLSFHQNCEGVEVLNKMLGFESLNRLSLVLPQVGFILGSTMGVLVFLYLTNNRNEK